MGEPARDTRSGELLNDAYELHDVLASEGSYDVYRATCRETRRPVRVRLLRAEFALQSSVVQRFLGGSKTLAGLRHPNVSQVLAVEPDETGIPFVVEEQLPSGPWKARTGSGRQTRSLRSTPTQRGRPPVSPAHAATQRRSRTGPRTAPRSPARLPGR
jgi:serine/threonine protein kinase